MATDSDRFSNARSNIRETAKWLSAAFAGLSAFVIGGSPISGIGALTVGGAAFWIALIAVIVAIVTLGISLNLVLGVLGDDAVYRSDLLGDFEESAQRRNEEIRKVIDIIDRRAKDLLPHNYQKLQTISKKVSELQDNLQDLQQGSDREDAVKLLNELNETVDGLLGFAKYLRLQNRFEKVKARLLWLAPIAIVALLVYGVALGADHRNTESKTVIYNESKILDRPAFDNSASISKAGCRCEHERRRSNERATSQPCSRTTSSTSAP